MYKVFGHFQQLGEYTFRTSAYMQWGDSEESLGCCLLLNPGSADFTKINASFKSELKKNGEVSGVIKPDPTMEQLAIFLRTIYPDTKINGRFTIYNLFTLQNPKSTSAIDTFEKLVSTGKIISSQSVENIQKIKRHPWILLGWGCDKKTSQGSLLKIKSLWMKQIEDAGIMKFGKEHKNGKGYYYHPYPLIPTQRPGIIKDLVDIYHNSMGFLS